MGKAERKRPARLAEKLLHIRRALGLSQNELIRRMGLDDELVQQDISTYEQDQREPTLTTLLEYAKVAAGGMKGAGVYLLILIDDSRELPERLPDGSPPELIKSGGRSPAGRKGR
jgi:transcriptional regulator with XRE-family HTH domain